MTTPTRRRLNVRHRPSRGLASGQSQREVKEKLREYAALLAETVRINTELEEMREDLNTCMQENGIKEAHVEVVGGGFLIAERKEVIGNSSTYIDPAKFYKAVEDKAAALRAMKVSAADAKKLLAGKELDRISTVTPGQSKGIQLIIDTKKKV